MNKCVLYIPRSGYRHRMVQRGYVDTLRKLGWNVYVSDPKTKLGCTKFIEDYDVRFIFTHSKYGVRQLPIDIINRNNVTVFVNTLPLNSQKLAIDNSYEMAHDDEPDIINSIRQVVAHTHIEPHLWPDYMNGWTDNGIDLIHIPMAGNIIRALSPTCSILTDAAMIANFSHRQGIMKQLIEPLFKRLELLGYQYQVFGDDIWARAGLRYNGQLSTTDNRLAHIYSTAKVCPNVHTAQQVELQAFINERSFMIPLCGGIQVSDNPLVTKYIPSCATVTSTTEFITKVVNAIEHPTSRLDRLMPEIEHLANNHTYFNRLVCLLRHACLPALALEIEEAGRRMAVRHCWELEARLNAEERGIVYEPTIVDAA